MAPPAQKRFSEPVAVSSTASAGFPTGPCGLPRTTLGCGFDLLPLRARCTGEPRGSVSVRQDPLGRECRKERKLFFSVLGRAVPGAAGRGRRPASSALG